MSHYGDLYLEIVEMIQDGAEDELIRKVLRIPQAWIDEVRSLMDPDELAPMNTQEGDI